MRNCKFTEAISCLERMDSKPIFGNNEITTVMLGQCYYLNGEHDTALTYFQRAYSDNPDCLEVLSKHFWLHFKGQNKNNHKTNHF